MPPTPVKRYTLEEIERALWAMALYAGKPTAAADALAAQGHKYTKQTIHKWATEQYRDRYEEIRTEASSIVSQRIASESEAFALNALELQSEIMEKLREQVANNEVRDLAAALRNVSTSGAIQVDKANILRGRPTVITANNSADDLTKALADTVRELKQLGVSVDDIPEADIVSE